MATRLDSTIASTFERVELGEFLGDALAALHRVLGAAVGVREQALEGSGALKAFEGVKEVVGHGFNPFRSRRGSARGLAGGAARLGDALGL